MEKEQERNLAKNDNANGGKGSTLFDPPSKPGNGKEGTYDCDEGCEVDGGPPVCGVNGITYFNECLAVCQDVDIERNGACPSEPPTNKNSFFKEGKVTKKEMNAFKAEKFKLVAKRKPQHGELPDREEPHGDSDGPGNSTGNPGAQRSARVVRLTKDGLEYVAEYDMDAIPEGVSYDPTEGDIPETDGDMTVPDGSSDRLLSVLGADTRFEQTGYNWPNWRLTQLDYGGVGRCSGSIIAPNKILTAAHCVYDTSSSSWMVPNRVAPGRAGRSDPWGQWDVLYATTYTNWLNGDGWEYDIAVLTIAGSGSAFNTNIGSYMGTLGMIIQPCSYTESEWRITGYPGDKSAGTVWNTGNCDDWSYVCGSRKIYHKCDTAGGMSGAAIRDGSNRIVGVHAYGTSRNGFNSGTALNSYHLANVQNW